MILKQIVVYDTTLRDGTQAEGISFSVHDKIRIAEKLDAFGVHYFEWGWPGSNPKDIAFFDEANGTWKTARICLPIADKTFAGGVLVRPLSPTKGNSTHMRPLMLCLGLL